MSSNVKDNNYIVIQGYMINQLNLKGNELLIYAIIYGFSQTDEQVFTGSLQYLADWTNTTRRNVQNCLKLLVEKGLITKIDKVINNVKLCEYNIVKQGVEKISTGVEKISTGVEKISTNNIINNINIKENIISKDIIKEKSKKPTIKEIDEYCKERKNNVDPNAFYDYYESNGWKVGKNTMKDWRAAVRTWERNSKSKVKSIRDKNREFFERKRREIEEEKNEQK